MLRREISLLAFALALTPVYAGWQQEITRNFDRTVTLTPAQRVRIESKYGAVRVRGGAQRDLVIHATIRTAASSREEAQQLADAIRIEVDSRGSTAYVKTIYPERNNYSRHNLSFSVSYEIQMPEGSPLEISNDFGEVVAENAKAGARIVSAHGPLRVRNAAGSQRLENSFGEVEVTDVNGDVVVNSGNGNVTVSNVTQDVEVHDRFGKVTVRNAPRRVVVVNQNGGVSVDGPGEANITNSFGEVNVYNARGDVTIQNANGAIVATKIGGIASLKTSFSAITATELAKEARIVNANGNVRADRVGGRLTATTSFGQLDLSSIDGPLEATNQNGAIKVNGVRGPVTASTSFNGITLEDVTGAVDVANQNGSVYVAGTTKSGCQPIVAKTSFGPIKVALHEGVNYDVWATTTFGGINAELPITVTGAVGGDQLRGRIGNGGCELKLTDSNGRIEILKRR